MNKLTTTALRGSLRRPFSSSSSSSDFSSLYRPRRALFYVPGSNPKMLQKSLTFSVDTLCFDLEDSVAPQQKAQARANIAAILSKFPPNASVERLVRINPIGSGYEIDDLKGIFTGNSPPDGLVIPKLEDSNQIHELEDRLSQLWKIHYPEKSYFLPLIGLIESAKAIENLSTISRASEQLKGFIFGADDYAASIEAERTESNEEIFFARQAVLNAAKAAQLQAIDLVQINYQNDELLTKECKTGAQYGFTGKQAIHPRQIPIIQQTFSPSPARISWAQRVVNAAQEHEDKGVGAFTLDNQMIDMPTIKIAQKIVLRARACRLID